MSVVIYFTILSRNTKAELVAQNQTVPEDFKIDITDPELFNACDVPLPEKCESELATDSAPSLIATPLVALLFAIVAKLLAF